MAFKKSICTKTVLHCFCGVIMGTKNVTLTIDEELLMEARVLAARRRTSVSGLVREQLEHLVGGDRARRQGWLSVRHLFDRPSLRIGSRLPTRDEIHER
jgi:hypothetical protein